MTLIVAATARESIWLLADRRLSQKGSPPRDDGRKIMFLETTDGVAMLGYAGLGATARGTEPADWMSAVLRGRNLPLEQSLGVLAAASQKQLPPHLQRGIPAHHVIAPAFVGNEVRLYSIDLVIAPDRKAYRFRYTRYEMEPRAGVRRTARLAIGGSGALYLMRDTTWQRSLLRLVRACDCGAVTPRAVSRHLARLNHDVHLATPDGSVGSRCVVAWRFRKGGVNNGGGGQQFYTGADQDPNSASLPTIVTGIDLSAVVQVIMPHMIKQFRDLRAGRPVQELNREEVNADLAQLPDKPDEDLH